MMSTPLGINAQRRIYQEARDQATRTACLQIGALIGFELLLVLLAWWAW